MSKVYSLQQSELYRLRNRRKLAELLGLPPAFFRYKHDFQYSEYQVSKSNGEEKRQITDPEDDLKRIQKRLCKLFSRIETPDWLISGKKHKSYITNAKEHLSGVYIKTMDISKFYDSTQRKHVFRMFKDTFLMEPDIARLLTDLVTYDKRLPTGGPTSQIVVFLTYRKMFERIYEIAVQYDCRFTLYVDDMTFSSMKPISRQLRDEVAMELKKCGLYANAKKDHYYQGKDTKIVTGVAIRGGKQYLRNKHRKSIIDQYKKCKNDADLREVEKLSGMLGSARQIEPEIFPGIANFLSDYHDGLIKLSRGRNAEKKSKKAV